MSTVQQVRAMQDVAVRRQKQGKQAKSVGYHLLVLAITVVVTYPGLWMVLSAFKPSEEIVGNVNLIPETWTMQNFSTALEGVGGVGFWTFFGNSMILAVASVVGTVASSAVTAYAFARMEFPGKKVWFGLMIGTLLLPFHVVIIPQYIIFNNLDLIDTFWPILLPKFLATEAFFVFLLVQFMRQMPRDMDEAARIDGAGHLRIFWSIILPLIKPALITCSIFAFIWAWNDFLGPLLYLNRAELQTVPLALNTFLDSTGENAFGELFAMSTLSLAPIVGFFIVSQRLLIEGIATTGMK